MFEIVEEVSVSLFRMLVVTFVADVVFYAIGEFVDPIGFLVVYGIFMGFAALHGINEALRWWAEVYVVTLEQIGGGRVYKFSGYFSKSVIQDKIQGAQPAVSHTASWEYRLWAKMTGEKMVAVKLFSANHGFYMDGKKVSPDFVQAIMTAQGAPPRGQEPPTGRFDEALTLKDLWQFGLIDRGLARSAAERIVLRGVGE